MGSGSILTSMGSESTGTLVPWEMRRCSTLPSGVPAQIPAVPSSRPYKSGEIRSAGRGGIGFMKERQVLVVLSLSYLPFAPQGVFTVVKKNSPSTAAALLEQISGIGEEYRDYLLLFAWFEQTSFTHLYSLHVTGTNGGHKALCSCPGWGEKKKLHLIDRSLGFWSRSHAPLR